MPTNMINLDDDSPVQGGTLHLSADGSVVANPTQTGNNALESTYDHYTKQILVADVSGSMRDWLVGYEDVNALPWDAHVLANIDKRIENAKVRQAVRLEKAAEFESLTSGMVDADPDDDDDLFDDDMDDEFASCSSVQVPHVLPDEIPENDDFWCSMEQYGTEYRKAEIVRRGFCSEINLRIPHSARKDGSSKNAIMRKVLHKYVEERFDKWTDSDIILIEFASRATLNPANSKDALLRAIDQLHANGNSTDITKAVERAMACCKRAPSPVHCHHIILVTDGLDYGAGTMTNLLPQLKELGIVVDVIHVCAPHEMFSRASTARSLMKVCSVTGGEYRRVSSAADFEDKVLEAGRRLCLPPAPGQ